MEFDESARASQEQRLTADALKDLLASEPREPTEPLSARRAWMVRGSNVEGYNLVDGWLADGYVSLSASQLTPFTDVPSFDELRPRVDNAYEHKSYAYRAQRLEELDRFLRRVQSDDLVLTTTGGKVYLGRVTGPAYFAEPPDALSNVRRDVRWLNAEAPGAGSTGRPARTGAGLRAATADLPTLHPTSWTHYSTRGAARRFCYAAGGFGSNGSCSVLTADPVRS